MKTMEVFASKIKGDFWIISKALHLEYLWFLSLLQSKIFPHFIPNIFTYFWGSFWDNFWTVLEDTASESNLRQFLACIDFSFYSFPNFGPFLACNDFTQKLFCRFYSHSFGFLILKVRKFKDVWLFWHEIRRQY